jgi:hypothetical protein
MPSTVKGGRHAAAAAAAAAATNKSERRPTTNHPCSLSRLAIVPFGDKS